MQTTYVERANTHAEVFRKANVEIENETRNGTTPKVVKPFVTGYPNSGMKRLARIHGMNYKEAVGHAAFAPDLDHAIEPWILPNRRIWRLRFKWATETIKDTWNNIEHESSGDHFWDIFCKKSRKDPCVFSLFFAAATWMVFH